MSLSEWNTRIPRGHVNSSLINHSVNLTEVQHEPQLVKYNLWCTENLNVTTLQLHHTGPNTENDQNA